MYFDNKQSYLSLQLNSELHVAGEFIYDACLGIYNLVGEVRHSESELFTILYFASVGIERLQKIIVIMKNSPNSEEDLEKIEKKEKENLYKHSTHALSNSIDRLSSEAKLTADEKKLTSKLTEFYNNYRYGYYHFGHGQNAVSEKFRVDFAGQKIGINDSDTVSKLFEDFVLTREGLRSFFDTFVQIVSKYLKLIRNLSRKNGVFTDETESQTKLSFIINYSRDGMNLKKGIALRELSILELAYVLSRDSEDKLEDMIDPADLTDYIKSISGGQPCQALIDAYCDSMYYEEKMDEYNEDVEEIKNDENFNNSTIPDFIEYRKLLLEHFFNEEIIDDDDDDDDDDEEISYIYNE